MPHSGAWLITFVINSSIMSHFVRVLIRSLHGYNCRVVVKLYVRINVLPKYFLYSMQLSVVHYSQIDCSLLRGMCRPFVFLIKVTPTPIPSNSPHRSRVTNLNIIIVVHYGLFPDTNNNIFSTQTGKLSIWEMS